MVPVHRVNVGEKFQEWEIQQQEVLQKMVGLIAELRDVVREQNAGTCVVLCENKARPLRLEVFESMTRKMVLPEEIVKRYWRDSELGHGMG
jgi:septum formation inhibitor-activating ATPase MinD